MHFKLTAITITARSDTTVTCHAVKLEDNQKYANMTNIHGCR